MPPSRHAPGPPRRRGTLPEPQFPTDRSIDPDRIRPASVCLSAVAPPTYMEYLTIRLVKKTPTTGRSGTPISPTASKSWAEGIGDSAKSARAARDRRRLEVSSSLAAVRLALRRGDSLPRSRRHASASTRWPDAAAPAPRPTRATGGEVSPEAVHGQHGPGGGAEGWEQ